MKKSICFLLLCVLTNTVSIIMALSAFEDVGRFVERTTEGVVRDVDRSARRTVHETDKTIKHEFEPFSPTRPAKPEEQAATGLVGAQEEQAATGLVGTEDNTKLEGSLEGDDRTRDYTFWKLNEQERAGFGQFEN